MRVRAAVAALAAWRALAFEPIPLFLFADAREEFGEPLARVLADDGLDKAVAALRAFALVDRETITDEREPQIATDTIRLHRLVREVAADRRVGETRKDVVHALVRALTATYPEAEAIHNNPKTWPRARRLDAHALALVGGHDAPPQGVEERVADLLTALALYRHRALAAYAQARPLYEQALAIREAAQGPESLATAGSLNNLASLLQDQGDFAGVRPLYERALAIYEKVLGPEHPTTAAAFNNLAVLHRAQGDLARARLLCERALAIREKILGPEHFDTAQSLDNLALLLRQQGDLTGARALCERALAIREMVLGREHPETARSLNHLAGLLSEMGDREGARPLFERALAISETVLGPEHPSMARDLNNLAVLLYKQGDLAGARSRFERALAIRENMLGPEHPDTAVSLDNLAGVLRAQGDHAGARGAVPRVSQCACMDLSEAIMADSWHIAVSVFLPPTGSTDLDEWIAPRRGAAIGRIVEAVGRSPENTNELANDIFGTCVALRSQLDPLEARKATSRLKKVQRILNGVAKCAALIDSDPHISATINKSFGVQLSAAKQFLLELRALENVLIGLAEQGRRSKVDLSTALNGRPPSELEWLAGLSLPLVYERHFSGRAGRSRNAKGEVVGPAVRFVQGTLKELGRPYKSESIARAFTRLTALRDEHREKKSA